MFSWDGAGRRVWQRVMRGGYDIAVLPRRAYLRRRAPICARSLGERERQDAVAVLVESHRSGSDGMGRSRAEVLCARTGDEAKTGKRMVGVAKHEEPRTGAPGAQDEG